MGCSGASSVKAMEAVVQGSRCQAFGEQLGLFVGGIRRSGCLLERREGHEDQSQGGSFGLAYISTRPLCLLTGVVGLVEHLQHEFQRGQAPALQPASKPSLRLGCRPSWCFCMAASVAPVGLYRRLGRAVEDRVVPVFLVEFSRAVV